jgi:Uma2 family endonuclease
MEALKLATLADLLECPEERVELINGEIVRRPMARAEHGLVQSATTIELGAFTRGHDPGGWWIATEVSSSIPRTRVRERSSPRPLSAAAGTRGRP